MSRPFLLMVDSGSEDEPSNRYFGSLVKAFDAMDKLPEHHRKFAWIMEIRHNPRNTVLHYKDGIKVDPHNP